MNYIGGDESGKGDIFGPLVIACVYVNNKARKYLKSLHVRDSKKISDSVNKKIAIKIKQQVFYKVEIIEPVEYNRLYKRFQNQIHLMNFIYQRAITEVQKLVECNTALIDRYTNKIFEVPNTKVIMEINGERHIGVAAASILARAEVVKWFDIHTEVVKGASIEASDLLPTFSVKELKLLSKTHFAKVRRYLQSPNPGV